MSKTDDKRISILDAAITQFSQYGYRKTSMEDIAKQAGVSRPSLYSYFDNKEEIFRNLSQYLNETAFAAAEAALKDNRGSLPVARRVEAAIEAFSISMHRLLSESPHGAELVDENNRLCGGVAQGFYNAFEELLADELTFAVGEGELDLSAAGVNPSEAAEIIRLGTIGLKNGARDTSQYQERVSRFVRVYFAGLD